MREQGLALKEEDPYLKEQAHFYKAIKVYLPNRSEAQRSNWAAKAAFAFGNSWAFACRNEIRVEGLCGREQGLALKEEDSYWKEQAQSNKSIEVDFPN